MITALRAIFWLLNMCWTIAPRILKVVPFVYLIIITFGMLILNNNGRLMFLSFILITFPLLLIIWILEIADSCNKED